MTNRRAYRDRYYKKKNDLIQELGGVCVKCGSTEKLQFDHIDPATKSFTIGQKLVNTSLSRLREELAKCQLLCSECHRKKTLSDNGWDTERAHGTLSKYTKEKCRCIECRNMWNRKTQEYKKRKALSI